MVSKSGKYQKKVRTLRAISSLSVTPVPSQVNFIQPTIGIYFYLYPFKLSSLESLEIYNLSGLLMEHKKIADHQIWNAREYPEGIYIITAKLSSGDLFTQKVLVKK